MAAGGGVAGTAGGRVAGLLQIDSQTIDLPAGGCEVALKLQFSLA